MSTRVRKLADSVIWVVNEGDDAPAKDQEQCGNCWALPYTGGIEGSWEVATGQLHSLSEQQLGGCSEQSSGCNGGLRILPVLDTSDSEVEHVNDPAELLAEEERKLAARSALCAAVAANAIASLRAKEALAGALEELERAILAGDAASFPSAVSRFKAMQFEAAELAQARQLLVDEASEAGGTATETFH